MRKTILFFILAYNLSAQTDFNNISWKFRGPENNILESKGIIDIVNDPNNDTKIWVCTINGELLYNDNLKDSKSEWKKSTLNQKIYKIRFDISKPQTAYAIGDLVIWKTINGGKTWATLPVFQGFTQLYDIWTSRKGNLIAATKNVIYLSADEGKSWKQLLTTTNSRIVKQLWVQENERMYVLLDDNSGLYTDAPYQIWNDITLNQMRKEEMPLPEYEQFNAYIVQSGEVFHGFNPDRRKIVREGQYSIDGGNSYKLFTKPVDVIETVFLGDNLVFATKKGVFIWQNSNLSERNSGVLQGEFRMFAVRDFAGDNYFSGISTKGVFMMSNIGSDLAYEANNQIETYNYITNANPYKGAISYFSNENFLAVEENKLNYAGYNHLVGTKIIPVRQNITMYLSKKGEIGKWTANTTGNLADGKIEIFEFGASPVIDIYYNADLNTVYGLYKDGKFVRIKNPDASPNILMVKSYYQLPFENFEEGLIEEISADGKQILVTDKTNNLWLTTDEGNTWRKINIDAIKDLKINHLEYSLKYQRLFLATETGVFLGEDILNNITKWTNISKEIGQQPCVFIQLRSLDDQLAVMTRYKGIYSTVFFREPNQIITHTPSYINLNSPQYVYFTSEKLSVIICDKSKIKIYFTSNIPENPNVEYVVEVSDDNGNFPSIPFILKGTSIKNPVEVEFAKPQDPRRNGFRFRVLARGAIQLTGTATPEILISSQQEFISAPQNLFIYCDKEVVVLRPAEGNNNPHYSWEKDGNFIVGASDAIYKTSQEGTYIRTTQMNGCILKSIINLKSDTNLKPFLKPNVGFSYSGSSCVVDSFKLFTDFNDSYKYVWLRDDVEIKDFNKSEIFVKDQSVYKIIVTNQSGCTSVSESIKLKTCETATENRAILLNPMPISAEKMSFYTNEKSLLSSDGCSNANLQWLKDAQPIVGANKATLEVKESGNYVLQIEKLGCIATTNTLKISVETVLAVGEELPLFTVDVYPNPTEEKLYVSIPLQINTSISVKLIDDLGKLIENCDFSETKSKIFDLKTLQEGVYFLVFDTQGKRVVKKIIKKD
jgi:photosystem II stability/assembly factor-like uncharacterized protein